MVLALFTLEQYQGCRHENVRDLKQSGRQRQGRARLNNEFLPCVYRLIQRPISTSA